MAGHQPELFHPGVWVKNFALAGLARRHGATAVNLVVDNDSVKSTSLPVPSLTTAGQPWPHLASVPFDRRADEAPWEEAAVRDEGLFSSFPGRVGEVTADWNFAPLLPDFWAETGRADRLGERFVRARRALERRWGCHNREVPVSRLCGTVPFAWFACHLLEYLHRFWTIHNAVVHRYRLRNGIRSRNHPVPDLTIDGDWMEAPFWAWREGQRRRGRLMVAHQPGRIELRVGAERWPDLPNAPGEEGKLVAAWRDLERRGFKVRSRALTNTLFARLLLSDLFVHGIGGGKYDEVTDDLLRRFYGVEPPGYLVLSATLLLPLPFHRVTAEDERRLARRLRDLHWNPWRHVSAAGRAALARRADWVARQTQGRDERRERFRQLRGVLDEMRPLVADQEEQARRELELCRRQAQANEILRRRDYAFCLYPESLLRPFCQRFL